MRNPQSAYIKSAHVYALVSFAMLPYRVFQGTNLRINFKKKEKTYQKFLLFRTILVISHSISEIEFDGLCHFSMFDVPIIIMNGTHPNSIVIPLSQ